MAKKSKEFGLGLSTPILYIIIGIVLAVFKSQSLEWVMTAIGAVFVVSGIIDLVKSRTSSGTVSLIVGVLILVLGWTAVTIVLKILGVLIALKGIVGLIDVFKLSTENRTLIRFLFPILTVVVGLALTFGNALNDIMLIVGVLLIVDGVLGLIGSK